MPEIEDLAVSRVREVIGYCDRLKAEISVNDKTPVIDGSVLIYKDASRRKGALIGPVAVQVKGSATTSKKSLKNTSVTRPVELADLHYFRNNGGGIYFYVLVDLKARKTRIYSATLNPFKIERLLQQVKQGQQTMSLPFLPFPDDPQQIERRLEFAWRAGKQDVGLGSSPNVFGESTAFTLYSAEGIDLSRPATPGAI